MMKIIWFLGGFRLIFFVYVDDEINKMVFFFLWFREKLINFFIYSWDCIFFLMVCGKDYVWIIWCIFINK